MKLSKFKAACLLCLLLVGCGSNEHICVNGKVLFRVYGENFWRPTVDNCVENKDVSEKAK